MGDFELGQFQMTARSNKMRKAVENELRCWCTMAELKGAVH